MPIDAGIYANLLRGPKSVEEYDNEAIAARGNALQLQQQRMQMNALQQQQQDDQALRNYLSGNVKLDTPEGQAGLYRVAPKAAGGILKSQAEIAQANAAAKKDAEQGGKAAQEKVGEAMKNSRYNLEGVTTPEQYIAWHEQNHKDPVLGPYLASRGVTADQARARISEMLQKPGGFEQLVNESKLGAEKAYDHAMKQQQLDATIRGQDLSAATQRRWQDIQQSNNIRSNERMIGNGGGGGGGGVAMSRPFELTGEDGQQVVVQQDKQGNIRPVQGFSPKPSAPNAAQQKELMSINQQRSIVNGALNAVTSTPGAFTFKRGVAGKLPFGETLAGRTETPQETQARAYVFNNVSRVINERAGAAQSAQELARLNSFLPADTDGPEQIKNKLNGFSTYLNDLESGTRGKPTQAGGAPQPSNQGPKAGDVDGGYRFKGGDPSNPSNWEKVK